MRKNKVIYRQSILVGISLFTTLMHGDVISCPKKWYETNKAFKFLSLCLKFLLNTRRLTCTTPHHSSSTTTRNHLLRSSHTHKNFVQIKRFLFKSKIVPFSVLFACQVFHSFFCVCVYVYIVLRYLLNVPLNVILTLVVLS